MFCFSGIESYENHLGSSHWAHFYQPRPCFEDGILFFMKYRTKKGEFKKHAIRKNENNIINKKIVDSLLGKHEKTNLLSNYFWISSFIVPISFNIFCFYFTNKIIV